MIEALNKNDVNAFEQNKNALVATTDECMLKLKDIKPFKGNQTVKKSCTEALKFYSEEAKNEAEVISDYLVKRESFDKVKKAYETKGSKSKSKDEIDAYNAAVNEFNAANKKYNEVNNTLNKKRTDVTNDWNSTATKFIDKYTPKYK